MRVIEIYGFWGYCVVYALELLLGMLDGMYILVYHGGRVIYFVKC